MKDDHERSLTTFFPLCCGYLENADVRVTWAKPTDSKRVSSQQRALTSRRNLPRLHRHVTRVLYMHHPPCPPPADDAPQVHLYVLELDHCMHCVLLAEVRDNRSHANMFELVFASRLQVAVHARMEHASYTQVFQPYLLTVLLPRAQMPSGGARHFLEQ